MNRETKRLMAKQEAQAERQRARSAPLARGAKNGRGRRKQSSAGGEKQGRIKRWRRFLREVWSELKKVAWPSRGEVITYTVVVLVSVIAITSFVFVLDLAFGKAVLQVFKG
ncbi:MAG: preprotein translocase subunit SecE [Actinomycetota bacterium]